MKRNSLIIAAIIIVGGGVAFGVWFINSQQQPSTQPVLPVTSSPDSGVSIPEQPSEITIRMRNTTFAPSAVTVKKGTKVTWLNEDSLQHNVVASNVDNTGGLPTQNSLFGNGGSYSFTFETVGTFDYHCTPHPFMTGRVVVQ